MLYAVTERSVWPVEDRRRRYRSSLGRAEARVRQRDAGARWARIMALNAQLSAALNNEGLEIWLALERALHGYWLEVALDHYALGYDAGRAQAWIDAALARSAEPREKLRALAAALLELAEREPE
jgi:hypothetical protein